MPAVPATLNFTPLTDPLVWFPDKDAFNAWFASITVDIDGGNLPEATTTTFGAVKEATLAVYNPETVVPTYVNLATEDPVGNPTQTQIPSKQAYLDLLTKVDNLAIKFKALMDAQADAGQLEIT